MSLRDLLTGFVRPKGTEALRERAKREFARGENAAGVATLLEIGSDADAEVLCQIGECYETATGVLPNIVDAATWYGRAAEKGYLPAQVKLGELYLFGRRGHDDDDQAADAPGVGASRLRPKGVSVPADLGKALHWNTIAAAAGAPEAQARLGYQYAAGLGVTPDYSLAERWFAASAEQGAPSGQFGLGMLHAGAYLGTPDFEKAAHWFEKAAGQGDLAAKLYFALFLRDGQGVPADPARAATLLTEAAEADQTEAMFQLGQLYRDGVGVEANLVLAETWLRRAASRSHIPALLALARHLVDDSAMPDYGSAAVLLREAADLGDSLAQFYLGQFYNAGLGVPLDPNEAVIWFRKAADAGVVGAIESLGLMHVAGTGLDRNYETAFSLLRKAADEGSASAEFGLADLYNAGLGVERDPEAAVASYLRAAERGSAEACLRLGVLYATGDGVEQDYLKASEWYAEADARGNTDGKSNLAFLYIRGLGVSPDRARGLSMLEDLAEQDNVSAVWSLYHLHALGLYLPADAVKARRWLERAAELRSGAAACEFARQVEHAVPGAPPLQQVVTWLAGAAERGDAAARETLGRWFYDGKFIPRDESAGFQLLSLAAEQGNPFAQAWMGDVLNQGLGVIVDRPAARTWYERAAAQRHIGALTVLTGMILEGEPSEDDRAKLFSFWLNLAEAGDVTAQVQIADFCLSGLGAARSLPDALKWFGAAAAQGSTDAQVQLATLLLQAEDATDKDAVEAVELFQRAAARGNVDAEYNLGVCYRRGIGVAADRDKARQLYREAAIKGHNSAQLALGDLLSEIADNESLKEAVKWYEQASAAGVPRAHRGLARLYETGQGVEADIDKAIAFNRKAAEAGHFEAKQALDRLTGADTAA
jgi:TPR repeat protein